MKYALFVLLALGCGSKDDNDEAPFSTEVTKVDMEESGQVTADLVDVALKTTFSTNLDNVISNNWSASGSIKEGATAPEKCSSDTAGVTTLSYVVQFKNLKPLTQYSVRICAFNGGSGAHTTGITKTFTTGKSSKT